MVTTTPLTSAVIDAVGGKTRSLSAAVPPAIGWSASYPIAPTLVTSNSGPLIRGDVGISPRERFPNYTARPTYWVDVTKTDDTGNGLTEATAKRTIARAVDLANTGGVPARIRVKAGFYDINRLFCQGGSYPTVDIVFEAYNGRVIVSTQANSLVWTANGTYPWVTQASTTNVSTVWDTKFRDADGFYGELTKLTLLADVQAVPNSWAEVSGILYVNRADRLTAADANIRVLRATDNLRMQGTSQQNILLTGETEADGFDLEGGQAGCWRTLYTGGTGGTNVVHAAERCTFRYGGHSTGAVGNVAIEGLNGLAHFKDCDGSNGVTDCWNFHNALGATMAGLMVNCTGIRGGKFAYVSCNGVTAHDSNLAVVVVGGRFERNRGRTAHIIGSSKMWMYGVTLSGSLGDKVAVGSNEPGELTAEDTSYMIATDCVISHLAGKLSAGAYDTSTIELRRTPVCGALYAAAGATLTVSA